jgi:hypothetical protein
MPRWPWQSSSCFIPNERLRGRGEYARSAEIFHSHAQQYFHSGHHRDSHQRFR